MHTLRLMVAGLLLLSITLVVVPAATAAERATTPTKDSEQAVNIGSRRELFVDGWLVEQLDGAQLQLHEPTPREVVLQFDRPNEGNTSAYFTVIDDDGLYRMYYRGSNYDWAAMKSQHQVVCYAESSDGIQWHRPELGLFDFNGSKQNNIVWMGTGEHNFAPFKDANPACPDDQRYKALGGMKGGLAAFASADGIHWRQLSDQPVITKGAFDSQNLAFWDTVRGRYVDFHRVFSNKVRDIATCTSDDFLHWTEPQLVDRGDAQSTHYYTNAIVQYDRAPHLFLGFPKRFLPSREQAVQPISKHTMKGLSDGVLISSRDGQHWHCWQDAFIRPGLNEHRWWQRNNMTAWGLIATPSDLPGGAPELSLYSSENYYTGPGQLRRYTLRLDGFVSVSAPYAGGSMTTRPFVFDGRELEINFSTSAAGSLRCELQEADGTPIEGFTLADCPEIYGDRLEHVVQWKRGADVSTLAGRPVRLRVELSDADLYSLRFRP